jgi:hypothetical protein
MMMVLVVHHSASKCHLIAARLPTDQSATPKQEQIKLKETFLLLCPCGMNPHASAAVMKASQIAPNSAGSNPVIQHVASLASWTHWCFKHAKQHTRGSRTQSSRALTAKPPKGQNLFSND